MELQQIFGSVLHNLNLKKNFPFNQAILFQVLRVYCCGDGNWQATFYRARVAWGCYVQSWVLQISSWNTNRVVWKGTKIYPSMFWAWSWEKSYSCTVTGRQFYTWVSFQLFNQKSFNSYGFSNFRKKKFSGRLAMTELNRSISVPKSAANRPSVFHSQSDEFYSTAM